MLKEVFYEDGNLFWKEQNKNRSRKMNSPIGSPANGYLVTSYKNKTKYIHRIVWELFYGDIPNGMTVDHIDGNKINNKIENLQLLSIVDNVMKSIRDGSHHNPERPVIATCVETGSTIRFYSSKFAKRVGFNQGNISSCLSGRNKKHSGFYWNYA